MLDITAVRNASTKSKGAKNKHGVRVTGKVLARATEDPTQACISIHDCGEGLYHLKDHRGVITVALDGATYRLQKTDSHAAWATRQGEHLEDFVELFNVLAETPDQCRGSCEEVAD